MNSGKLVKSMLIVMTLALCLPAKALTSSTSATDDEQYLPIPELNQKAPTTVDDTSIFDEVRIHAGASFIDSFQNYTIAPGVREQGAVQGVQVSLAADLFDPHLICEGDLVSLAQTTVGDTQISANGFELRLLYETPILEAVTLHFGAGVASRNYDIKTTARPDGSVSTGEQTFSSGATVLVSGLDYWLSGSFSTGVELADHLPMSSGDDPSSIDLGVRLTGHF